MAKKHQYSGHPGDCSPEQLQALDEIKKIMRNEGITDPQYDDVFYLRFLRARKFNLKKTTLMLNNFFKWRKDEDVDGLYNFDYPEINQVRKYFPHLFFRTDREGRPIYIEKVGMMDFNNLKNVTTKERFKQYFVYAEEHLLKEKMPACSEAAGKTIGQTCYIMDLKHGGLKLFTSKALDWIKVGIQVAQDYYPETLGKMFIINAPALFYGAWAVVKHLVDEKTRNKIHIMGSNYQQTLLEHIEPQNLPDFMGGTATEAEYGPNFDKEDGPWIGYVERKRLEQIQKEEEEMRRKEEEERQKALRERAAKPKHSKGQGSNSNFLSTEESDCYKEGDSIFYGKVKGEVVELFSGEEVYIWDFASHQPENAMVKYIRRTEARPSRGKTGCDVKRNLIKG